MEDERRGSQVFDSGDFRCFAAVVGWLGSCVKLDLSALLRVFEIGYVMGR